MPRRRSGDMLAASFVALALLSDKGGTAVPAEISEAGCPVGTDLLVVTRIDGNRANLNHYIAVIA